MAAFNFHRRKTRRWWYAGATLMAAAFFAVFFVTSSAALNNSPSNFEAGDGNMVLDSSGKTDWNCFQGTDNFQSSANLGPGAGVNTFTKSDCAAKTGATNNSSPNPDFEQKPGQKFDTACPTFQTGNNPPKDVWSDVAQYLEPSSLTNSDGGHDLFFYGASIRPVVNGNSSGNIYFSQGTNPNGANCRTVGDVLLTFDFLGGGTKPTLHVLTWQPSTGSCYVGSDSPSTGCWGPSDPPELTGSNANSDGETNATQINGADNALNGADVLANGFSEIGVNLTQAIKQAGGTTTCFANETWVSRSSGSSFTSTPEMVVPESQPTCGSITIIKHTNPRGLNQQFGYTTSGLSTDTSGFSLNDGGYTTTTPDVACTNTDGTPRNSTTASPCNTRTFSDLPLASYSVTETAPSSSSGFAFDSVSCTKNGSAVSSGSGGLTISSRTVSISLGISDTWVCTYVNDQQLGAIKITKQSSKASTTLLGGAHFEVCTNAGPYTTTNPCSPAKTGSGDLVTSSSTGSLGTVCIDGLAFGTYYVTETQAPTGYGIDNTTANPSSQTATVNTNTTCSSTSGQVSLTFTDTPLSKIYLGWHSLAGAGVTTATIQCTGETSASTFTDSGAPGTGGTITPSKTLGNGTSTLAPGSYQCTVVIDP